MMGRAVACSIVAVCGSILLIGCKRDESPVGEARQPGQPLTATPSSVTVSIGTVQDVAISDGVPPYQIVSQPAPIASAQMLQGDSSIAVARVTGVSAASAAASLTVKDSSTPEARTVVIPVSVH